VLEQFVDFTFCVLPLACLPLIAGAIVVYLLPFRWLGLIIAWALPASFILFPINTDVVSYQSGKGGDLPKPLPWILEGWLWWLQMVAVTFVPTRKWEQAPVVKEEQKGM